MLERFVVDEEIKRGYKHVYSPDLANIAYIKLQAIILYKDSMYPVMKVDEEELMLRPMTCPHPFSSFTPANPGLQRAAIQDR
jgi:threonyl-tRNA synthetase